MFFFHPYFRFPQNASQNEMHEADENIAHFVLRIFDDEVFVNRFKLKHSECKYLIRSFRFVWAYSYIIAVYPASRSGNWIVFDALVYWATHFRLSFRRKWNCSSCPPTPWAWERLPLCFCLFVMCQLNVSPLLDACDQVIDYAHRQWAQRKSLPSHFSVDAVSASRTYSFLSAIMSE